MDYEVGTCENCGGRLEYVYRWDAIMCDTCSMEDDDEED